MIIIDLICKYQTLNSSPLSTRYSLLDTHILFYLIRLGTILELLSKVNQSVVVSIFNHPLVLYPCVGRCEQMMFDQGLVSFRLRDVRVSLTSNLEIEEF